MNTRLSAAVAAALLLAGCAGGPSLDGLRGTTWNYAADSALGAALPPRDQEALAGAFVQAVDAGGAGERFDWRGPSAFGWVKAGAHRLGGLKPVREDRPTFPDGLYLEEPLETELGLYAVKSAANVRLGPSTDYAVLGRLTAGDGVLAVGRVVGKAWILAEREGRVIGYVSETLMVKAPGTELELAGGPTKRAQLCRDYEQRISMGGQSDRWDGVACRISGRWTIEPPPEGAPTRLF